MYILVSVIIVSTLLLISYLRRFQNFRDKHQDFYNFLLTIAATFIGVFLAIGLTDMEFEKKNRDNAIKLIELADLNVKQSFDGVTQDEVFIKNQVINNENKELDSLALTNYFLNNNSLPNPSLFEKTLENELVLKHISRKGLRELYVAWQNLEKQSYAILNSKTSVENKMLFLSIFKRQLDFIHKGLLTEIEFIEGHIHSKEAEYLYQQHGLELMGITQKELDEIVNNK